MGKIKKTAFHRSLVLCSPLKIFVNRQMYIPILYMKNERRKRRIKSNSGGKEKQGGKGK